MAAYAALVSLMNNMEQIMNHPRLSTSLDKYQIESLREKLDFLLNFVESYSSHGGTSMEEVEGLERQIASSAHAAEDVIESHIVDRIHAESSQTSDFLFQLRKQIKSMKKKVMKVILGGSTERSSSSLINLQKIIEDMDSIKEKVIKVKEERGLKDQQPTYSMPATSFGPLTTGKNTMVGFDDELIQLMDVLTGQQSSRHIISIVGMGGMGKTTLARNVYENLVIMQHFDFRTWATISQEYSVREILLELLSCNGNSTSETVDGLGEQLYKSLSGKRYLIILDDMWSIEVWDRIKIFLPDNGNRSRVVLTTRLSNVAVHCGSSCFRMNFLDEDKSWNLFCEKVFGHEDCPPKLEKIGKKIVKLCKGLPLSIVVIGGLLRKSYKTIRYWSKVSKNINLILNSRENGQCLNVLYLSYSQLPAHLKPCFLYMAIFQEDYEIRVSGIIKLWVAEGFLKPNGVQILEEIAEDYLKDLIDRNLILVCTHRPNGKIKSCRIHDLLRDLCLRVAKKEKFFCVARAHSIPRGMESERRLIFHCGFLGHRNYKVFKALESASLARSLICKGAEAPVKFRLLRVLSNARHWSTEAKFQNVNLRYFAYRLSCDSSSMLPSSISLSWNLQTLIINVREASELIVAPPEIWKMPQLRHLKCSQIFLPDPPPSNEEDDSVVLGNLQTLAQVVNFRLNEEACKRIPNIKKLRIFYDDFFEEYDDRLHYNLGRLHKLESLNISCHWTMEIPVYLERKAFPSSLNKLSIANCVLHWDNLTMIGSLPQLEVLKLERVWDGSGKWSPVNGEFLRLKFLSIKCCYLSRWTADNSHFPVLEKLVLGDLWELKEIPWGIGEIPTLQLIRLDYCNVSAAISAMKIKEEQESLGNNDLQIQVCMCREDGERLRERVEIEGLSINNIQLLEGWNYRF